MGARAALVRIGAALGRIGATLWDPGCRVVSATCQTRPLRPRCQRKQPARYVAIDADIATRRGQARTPLDVTASSTTLFESCPHPSCWKLYRVMTSIRERKSATALKLGEDAAGACCMHFWVVSVVAL